MRVGCIGKDWEGLGRIEELHFEGGKDGGILPAACRTGQTSRSAYRPQYWRRGSQTFPNFFSCHLAVQSVYALSVLNL